MSFNEKMQWNHKKSSYPVVASANLAHYIQKKYQEVAIFTLLIFKFFSCTQYVLNVKGSDEINSVE